MSPLLVASRNRKKLAELRRVLDAAGVTGLTLVSLDDVAPFEEAPETGAVFEENALAKARDAFAATGLASVADDSGLEVAALNGMPGVRVAAGAIAGCARRAACRVVRVRVRAGVGVPGRIAREPRGDGGFGYDPVFVPDDAAGRTAAQLSPAEKDAVSHRGRALRLLVPALETLARARG